MRKAPCRESTEQLKQQPARSQRQVPPHNEFPHCILYPKNQDTKNPKHT